MDQVPLFVKLENYDEVANAVEQIKAKIEDARRLLDEISNLKAEEDLHLGKWKQQLSAAEERLAEIDKTLTKPEVM